MFLGRYDHTIDEKGRVTVPARFREQLEDGGFITRGFDKNLMVLTSESFDVISQRVQKMSLTNPLARDLRRMVFSNADRIEIDKAGRMLIPAFLREFAALDSAVTVVGSGDYIEIWATETWLAQDERFEDSQNDAERFAALDLSTS